MGLSIEATTRIEQIHKLWHLITKWQSRLQDFNQTTFAGYDPDPDRWAKQMEALRNEGRKNPEIARIFEEYVSSILVNAAKSPALRNEIELIISMLDSFGHSSEDIQDFVSGSLHNVKAGQEPFAPGAVLSGDRVGEMLKHLRNKKKRKAAKT